MIELGAPLWLLLWPLVLGWWWLRRRAVQPLPIDTGALELWSAPDDALGAGQPSRPPLGSDERWLLAALCLAPLALAQPNWSGGLEPGPLDLWVERTPAAFLPVSAGAQETRLGRALERLQTALEGLEPNLRPRRLRAHSGPDLEHSAGSFTELLELLNDAGPAGPVLQSFAEDRPGVLWIALDAPDPLPLHAAWVALAGETIPGPVAFELERTGGAPRCLVFDGEALHWEPTAIDPGSVALAPELPGWLARFAGLWADSRGLPVVPLEPTRIPGQPGLCVAFGPAAQGTFELEGVRFEARSLPSAGSAAPQRAFTSRWSLGGSAPQLPLLSGASGELAFALADWPEPKGDPARTALALCRLFDRARALPPQMLSIGERRGRRPDPAALPEALRAACSTWAQGPGIPGAPRPLARWPAWAAALAAGIAAASWRGSGAKSLLSGRGHLRRAVPSFRSGA